MPWIEMVADCPPPGFKAQLREKRPWYEIRNAASDEAELLLFDEIGGWYGTYADEFVQELKAITASKVTVRLNSPGGSVFEGIAVANALRAHPAQVIVRVEGLAASIASVIALAGDRLQMMPQSTLMVHEASGACLGNAADMTKMAEVLDLLSDNIADAYATKAGGSREQWRAAMKEESWYTADEAVAAGLADEVLRDIKPAEESTNSWDLSIFRYAGRHHAPAPANGANPGLVKGQVDRHTAAHLNDGGGDTGARHPHPDEVAFDVVAFREALKGAFGI
ncbi:head maturation protease, ClpP-related [Nonomuraea insulae]|uniref:ATP-dependent Clp protease proteolytic subunit n=1 Tax=Nonomuraea insulae TaxID=1616787 RepID=A0ABW1DAQ3_9ACTN